MCSLSSVASKAGRCYPLLLSVGRGVPRLSQRHLTRPIVSMAAADAQQSSQQTAGVPYTGHCACGTVHFKLESEPDRQLFCHCSDCQIHHAAPIRQSIIWTDQDEPSLQPDDAGSAVNSALRIVQGGDDLTRHNHTAANNRYFCRHCGTAVFNYSPVRRTISVPPINVQSFIFKPQMHIYCAHGNLARLIHDGLPKYKDRPKDQGGSGECI